MRGWMQSYKNKISKRLIATTLAGVMAVSFGTYELVKPMHAAMAAAPAPAAAALDENSVEALLALDRAMETVAARVTPAIVNVTVTSKTNGRAEDSEEPDDMQQFNP